ncbi:MAG: VCBS repeat-containing protein [bacterium]|nr:VCBS repeat-containing protein [Candidatus Kapabacteria bacterium]
MLLVAGLLVSTGDWANAQSDTVRPNPNAVELQRMWVRYGGNPEFRGTGAASAAIGDLNGDGLMDFAVSIRDSMGFFLGASPAPSMIPFQTKPDAEVNFTSYIRPALGDFWGSGKDAIAFMRDTDVVVYRTESGRLPDTAAQRLRWEATPNIFIIIDYMTAADLDNDGFDELIVGAAGRGNSSSYDGINELLIYRGGPSFTLDAPTVIIKDDERDVGNSALRIFAVDIDGDSLIDIVTVNQYADRVYKLKIHFGDGMLPATNHQPDRIVGGFHGENSWPAVADVDDDGIVDIMRGDALYLSGRGKNARQRSFTPEDADVRFLGGGGESVMLGPLNDRYGKVSMIGRLYGDVELRAFSGRKGGPDVAYDAHYAPELHAIWAGNPSPLGDVNGDGWHDVLFSTGGYPEGGWDYGIAMILSGGAYIPRDSLALSAIRDVNVNGLRSAFTIWPLPASNEINIAWRGDLPSVPRIFTVHDALGHETARGSIPDFTSRFTWASRDWPAGIYIISLLDQSHRLLLSQSVLKQ